MSRVAAGRRILYYVCKIQTYRTRLATIDPITKKLVTYRREPVVLTGPHFFKEKTHAGPYCKQIAFANREAGPYDWTFAVQWIGTEYLRAKEDAHAATNGHECPRCHAMTLQGGLTDLCERCSRLH